VLRAEGYTERAIFVIDKQGIIRYVDVHDINEQPSNEVLRAAIREIDPEVRDSPEEPKPAPVELPHGGIVMYCTRWCPDCKRMRRWFAERQHCLPRGGYHHHAGRSRTGGSLGWRLSNHAHH